MLFAADGRALLADFGSSRLAVRVASETRTGPSSLLTGATPAFAAPETIVKAADASPASDVWSLGATLLCLLTGHELAAEPDVRMSLLSGLEPLWTLERHVRRELRLPGRFGAAPKAIPHAGLSDAERARWEAAPADLRAFVGRCLVADPDARASAADLCLDPFVALLEARLSPREPAPPLVV